MEDHIDYHDIRYTLHITTFMGQQILMMHIANGQKLYL